MFKNTPRNRDIDFLLAYNNSEKKPSRMHQYYKYFVPPMCLILLCGSGFAFLKFQELGAKADIEKIKEEIATFDKSRQENKTDEKYQTLQNNKTLLSSILGEAAKINSYPQLSKDVVNAILKITSTVTLTSMNYVQESGELSITVEAKDVTQTNTFVSAVRNSGLFKDVKYTGYTENKQGVTSSIDPATGKVVENTAGTTSTYVVNVVCILKEGA